MVSKSLLRIPVTNFKIVTFARIQPIGSLVSGKVKLPYLPQFKIDI